MINELKPMCMSGECANALPLTQHHATAQSDKERQLNVHNPDVFVEPSTLRCAGLAGGLCTAECTATTFGIDYQNGEVPMSAESANNLRNLNLPIDLR